MTFTDRPSPSLALKSFTPFFFGDPCCDAGRDGGYNVHVKNISTIDPILVKAIPPIAETKRQVQ